MLKNRLDRVHKFVRDKNLDGLIVISPVDVFYLSGVRQEGGVMFFGRECSVSLLVVDGRYFLSAQNIISSATEKLKSQIKLVPLNEKLNDKFLAKKNLLDLSITKIKTRKLRIGIDDNLSLREFYKLQKSFPDWEFKVQKNLFLQWRKIKDLSEIKLLKKSAKKMDVLIPCVQKYAREGISERELKWKIIEAITERGKYKLSFSPIVAFGPSSAQPHCTQTEAKLQKNSNILVDAGIKVGGYCSDITRNFFFGTPTREYLDAFDLLLTVQKLCIKQSKAGESISATERFARKKLGKFAKSFTHSLGHGVGLQIHEFPIVSQKTNEVFKKNQVVTSEPGIYFPGKFGIRIEDTILITKKSPQILTLSAKNLNFIPTKT